MLDNLLEDKLFVDLMKVHANEIISFLLEEGVQFTVLANMLGVNLEPPLSKKMMQNFRPITPFALHNYTFESSSVDEDFLHFEAGFGEENIGAFVSIKLEAVLQIIVKDTPIFINMAVPSNKETSVEKQEEVDGMDKSMKALLSNPKNKKLLKD